MESEQLSLEIQFELDLMEKAHILRDVVYRVAEVIPHPLMFLLHTQRKKMGNSWKKNMIVLPHFEAESWTRNNQSSK